MFHYHLCVVILCGCDWLDWKFLELFRTTWNSLDREELHLEFIGTPCNWLEAQRIPFPIDRSAHKVNRQPLLKHPRWAPHPPWPLHPDLTRRIVAKKRPVPNIGPRGLKVSMSRLFHDRSLTGPRSSSRGGQAGPKTMPRKVLGIQPGRFRNLLD